jgi:peptide subunit release factor 1 (eRF1)
VKVPGERLRARLAELARIGPSPSPVVSVYLATRWADEHQRDRVRVFLKRELARAREGGAGLAADLDWIETEAAAIVEQARLPDARGVVLFAGGALGLREVLALRVAVDNRLVVDDGPWVRPLAEAVEAAAPAIVAFVDAESARLVELSPGGLGDEVALASEVPGHHRRGGWAQLAQSRYQRHIQNHRGRHFDAVAAALDALVDGHGVERIVLAGDARTTAAFRAHLDDRLARRVLGVVEGSRHDGASVLADRAAALIEIARQSEEVAAVDAVLVEAAKGGRAVAGVAPALEAAAAGAVHRLYLLRAFSAEGGACRECDALQPDRAAACARCGRAVKPVELGEALARRVLATGGGVQTVAAHAGLAGAGGVAARLRYASE